MISIALFTTACGKKKVKIAQPPRIGSTESGIASWYGIPYHGRRAANGEIYDMEKLTAAHRTLPFETWVRVENLTNGKKVDVRIQDRGPFIDGRIIDLSKAAAREIDMIGPGIVKVRLTIIPPPPRLEVVSEKKIEAQTELFAVQVGAFRDQSNAERVRLSMQERFGPARLVTKPADTMLWRVLVGEEDTMEKATLLAARIRESGTDGFVVRLDGVE
jgi:rare lipoprotein A